MMSYFGTGEVDRVFRWKERSESGVLTFEGLVSVGTRKDLYSVFVVMRCGNDWRRGHGCDVSLPHSEGKGMGIMNKTFRTM